MGDYEISYRVAMEEFPDLGYTGTFTARIRFCFLERLIPTPITPRLYQVGVEEALEITWTDFAQEPSICNHEVKYDFFLINEDGEVRDLERGGNLPDWLTFWDSGRRFEVLTDDVDDVGDGRHVQLGSKPINNTCFNPTPYQHEVSVSPGQEAP